MKFHHRYDEDGTCEIICTRCFSTIGHARGLATIRDLQSRHGCYANIDARRSSEALQKKQSGFARCTARVARLFDDGKPASRTFAFFAIAVVFYALPTIVEFVIMGYFGPWMAGIVLGDLLGCVFLATAMKMRRTGILLYLVLTASEGTLYLCHYLSANGLILGADVVPALIIVSRFLLTSQDRTLKGLAAS